MGYCVDGFCLVDDDTGQVLGSASNPNRLKDLYDRSGVVNCRITYCRPDNETLFMVTPDTSNKQWNEFAENSYYLV